MENEEAKKREGRNHTKRTTSSKASRASEKSSFFGLEAKIVVLIIWWGSLLLGILFGRTALAPFLSIIPPLVVLLMEKNSQLTRSHAGQALAINGIMLVISLLISAITMGITSLVMLGLLGIIGLVTLVLGVVSLIVAIVASIKGFGGEEFEIPVIGQLGKTLAAKVKLAS